MYIRGPDPPSGWDSEEDSCLEDYKWYAIILFICIIILGIVIIVKM